MVSVEVRRAVLFIHGNRCFYCGRAADAVDHIDPAGGDHPRNLTAACEPCNATKGDRPLPDDVKREALTVAFMNADMIASMAREFKEATKRAKGRIARGSLPLRVMSIMERDFK